MRDLQLDDKMSISQVIDSIVRVMEHGPFES